MKLAIGGASLTRTIPRSRWPRTSWKRVGNEETGTGTFRTSLGSSPSITCFAPCRDPRLCSQSLCVAAKSSVMETIGKSRVSKQTLAGIVRKYLDQQKSGCDFVSDQKEDPTKTRLKQIQKLLRPNSIQMQIVTANVGPHARHVGRAVLAIT
jgi:hypothetical protein